MSPNKITYQTALYNTFCVSIIGALMFFITQGNSMFITDLFAEKVVQLVDSETPAPAEERSDSGSSNNTMNEEFHHETTSFHFLPDHLTEINFQFESSSLHSVLKQRVLTPPPELS